MKKNDEKVSMGKKYNTSNHPERPQVDKSDLKALSLSVHLTVFKRPKESHMVAKFGWLSVLLLDGIELLFLLSLNFNNKILKMIIQ